VRVRVLQSITTFRVPVLVKGFVMVPHVLAILMNFTKNNGKIEKKGNSSERK